MEYSDLEMLKVNRQGSQEQGQGRSFKTWNTSRLTCRLVLALLFACVALVIFSVISLVSIKEVQSYLIVADACGPQPCANGGSCSANGDGTYTCHCTGGYSGRTCSLDIDECHSSPCLNNAVCVNSLDSFVCVCKDGWTGERCDADVDDCRNDPCLNGATCTDNGTDSFTCACAEGYTDATCATEINLCTNNPCQNGGTCYHGEGSFVCQCPKTWKGDLCNISAPLIDVARRSTGTTCSVSHTYDWYSCDNLIGDWGRWLSHEGPVGEWITLFLSRQYHVMTMNIQFSCTNMESCADFSVIYSDGSSQRMNRSCVGSPTWQCTQEIPYENYTLNKETNTLKLLCHTACDPASHDWAINQISVWGV